MVAPNPGLLVRGLVALSVAALSPASALAAQEPLWADDLVPTQPPARNAVPAKDDPALPTDNGSDSPIQAELRTLARIADDQTYQDTGDPVVPTIGMVSHRATDLFIEGRGMNFSFERRYSSHDSAEDGPLGFGWDHSYNLRLQINGGGAQVIVHNGNGRQDVYDWTATNSHVYFSPPGVYTLLKYEAPSTFILRNREGTKTFFSASTRLVTRIEDAAGNALRFFHDGLGNLDHVVDTMGRIINFEHDAQGRLEWIQDFRGRRVEYYYDAAGNLTGVRSPTVTSTGGFNDFPSGRLERYTYRPETTGALAHKLATIVRPNDVTQSAPPYGTPAVQFQYNTNSNSIFHGWCVAQVLGGTNAAGSAGGTITYAYEVLDFTTPIFHANARNIGRLKSRVTNRKNLVTDYVVNQFGHVIQVTDWEGSTPFTTTNEYNAEGELTKITQPRGNFTTTSYWTGFRHLEGSVSGIVHHRGPIASDQDTRICSFEYEPFFGNLLRETDFNGRQTTYTTDYQEGEDDEGSPDDVVSVLEADLLGIYTREQIQDLLYTFIVPLFDGDLNGDGQKPVAAGRVIAVEYPLSILPSVGGAPLALLEGDVYQEAMLTRTYDQYGQITSETDEEENVTVYLYNSELNPDGSSVPLPPGGQGNATTGGYLRRMVEDTSLPYPDPQLGGVEARWGIGRNSATNPPTTNITTDYRYNPSGQVVAVTDGRGVKSQYSVNELDEVWQYRRGTDVSAAATRAGGLGGASEDLSGQAFDFAELWRFDKNGNVIAHFTENAGGSADAVAVAGAPAGHWEEYWTYDILDNQRTETREYGFQGETATWAFTYDLNENLASKVFPEGNRELYTWDFRDQVSSFTRGSGFDTSQVSYVRDGNGNLRQTTDGRGKNTIIDYDGFDRATRVLRPAGTEEKFTYDAQSNAVSRSLWGHPGGPSPSGNDTSLNIELHRTSSVYDWRNRLIQVDRVDPQSPLVDGTLTPGDAKVTTVYNHDRLDRLVYKIDDDGTRTEQLYDGASRLIKSTDPVGNVVEQGYDDNGNSVKVTERDIYPNGAYRSFETYTVFDALDRAVSVTDNIGRTERRAHDSRDYVVHRSDAVASLSSQYINGRQINNPGNTVTIKVDGLGRVVVEESDLRVGGTGDGAIDSPPYNADGRSTRSFAYDRNSNLRFATDDNGETTEYQYDTLDRMSTIVFADETQLTQGYDRNDNVVSWQDAVGSQVASTYDDKNRLIAVDVVTKPASVVGTTKTRYEYDGLDRLTESIDSIDNVLGDANDWVNEYTWDALGRTKTQRQNNWVVTSTWREEAKQTSIAYPSGVTVQYANDALERPSTITQGVQLASFAYAGKARLLERSDFGGVAQRYHDGAWNDAAYYDGARRPVKLDFKKGAALLTGIEHGFDRANNRLFMRRLHDASKGDNFVYDSMYRLVTWERSVPAAAVGLPGGNSWDVRHGWDLDGAHSRRRTTRQNAPNQIPVPTVITIDDVHNYVTKQRGVAAPFVTWNQSFDLNGNKITFTDQGLHAVYKYDFLNRLRVIEKGSQKVEFDYDGENRRVRTRVTGIAGYPATTEFVHDGQHAIEEYNGAGVCLRRFYYGDELDELVAYDNLAFYAGPGRYFYQQDSAGDVVAIHNETGAIVERYSYGVYGSTFFETPLSVAKATSRSDFGNPHTFKALRFEEYFDPLCYVRARFLDCQDGNFLQRDPIGVWGDLLNCGGAKVYCASNPLNRTDPLGLQSQGVLQGLAQAAKAAAKAAEQAARDFIVYEMLEAGIWRGPISPEQYDRLRKRYRDEKKKKQKKSPPKPAPSAPPSASKPKPKISKHRADGKYNPGGTDKPGPVSEHGSQCPSDCPSKNPDGKESKYGLPPGESINRGQSPSNPQGPK